MHVEQAAKPPLLVDHPRGAGKTREQDAANDTKRWVLGRVVVPQR